MNRVCLTGNLCQDIEVKQSTGGKSVLTNVVAVKRDFKSANGEYDSDFIGIVVWGAQADYLSRYASKGDRVELVGRWTVRKYTANDGTTRTVNECVVESIKAFSKQKAESAPNYTNTQPKFEELSIDQELPF